MTAARSASYLAALSLQVAAIAPHAAPAEPAAATFAAMRRSDDRHVEIRLNGRRLLDGIAVRRSDGESVLVPVEALVRSIDGSSARTPARLRVDGSRLWAAAPGGCDSCRVHVARTVLVSGRVRAVEGVAAFPLDDLVAALEGRMERDAAPVFYDIHTGKCTWCILTAR